MKVPLQEKIAELESRIARLEQLLAGRKVTTRTTTTVDMEPEMSNLWKSVDALMTKVRRWF